MTAIPDNAASEHYLVSHGKCGALGSFGTAEPFRLHRGDRVVIDGSRGREVGTVLCPATVLQARILGAVSTGTIVRPLAPADEPGLKTARALEERLFEAGRQLARQRELAVEILDVEVLFEERAIVQFVASAEAPLEELAQTLGRAFQLDIRMENLALPEETPHVDGCGKPDCGKLDGGGCSTCGSGGGCSSCGAGATDLRPYFAHLRTQMETRQRTPLL